MANWPFLSFQCQKTSSWPFSYPDDQKKIYKLFKLLRGITDWPFSHRSDNFIVSIKRACHNSSHVTDLCSLVVSINKTNETHGLQDY